MSKLGDFSVPKIDPLSVPGVLPISDESQFDLPRSSVTSKLSDSPDANNPPAASSKSSQLTTLPRFEEMTREAKEILGFMDFFDGLQVTYNRGVSQSFHLTHTLALGSQVDEQSYNLAANYAAESLLMSGRIDTKGVLLNRVFYQLRPSTLFKSTVQLGGSVAPSALVGEVEHRGADYVAEAKLATTQIGASYVQSLRGGLSAGVELAYTHAQGMSGLRALLRYDGKSTISAAQVDTSGQLNLSFVQRINETCRLATEFVVLAGPRGWESVAAAGYHYDLRMSSVRAMLDSYGRITAIFEQKMNPAMSFVLTGEVDYLKTNARFGVGLNLSL